MNTAPAGVQSGHHVQPVWGHSSGYAFLNHSSMTLPNNLPPNADEQLAARHKRRRTSPEDQTVLEAAYTRNPKPDKAERLELVKQVALGEKEVQIWFQNRRQTSRRKSRPLLPHEIVQYQLSHSARAYNADYVATSPVFDHSEPVQPNVQIDNPTHIFNYLSSLSNRQNEALRTNELTSSLSSASQSSASDAHPSSNCLTSAQSLVYPGERDAALSSSSELNGFVGYLSNRRSAPSLHVERSAQACEQSCSGNAASAEAKDQARPALKKSSSVVRLSLSHEGNAEITTKDGASPSPPRVPLVQQAPADTESDQRTATMTPIHPKNTPLFKPVQRASSGRSRDSRAWEFWCDKDSRSELEDKAEKDASGSAADAIGLLRSASGRSILGSLPNKRNSFLSRQSSTKRPKLDTKPALKRSSTSLGRLQHNPHSVVNCTSRSPAKLKYAESATSITIPGNDSDKENWSPSTTEHTNCSVLSGDTLQEERSTKQTENDPEADAEIATFMRQSKSTNVSQEEELDCIQNLLSLSQGNWR